MFVLMAHLNNLRYFFTRLLNVLKLKKNMIFLDLRNFSFKRRICIFIVCFIIYSNKQKLTYDILFALIKQVWSDFNPINFLIDYKAAFIFKAFPDANINGYLFYLTKNLRKHLLESNLLSRYNNNREFALQNIFFNFLIIYQNKTFMYFWQKW